MGEQPNNVADRAAEAGDEEQPGNAADRAGPMPFDAIYKALFGDPATVADMMRHYLAEPVGPLPADLPDAIDTATLRRLPAEWVTREFRVRRGDQVWCVDFRKNAVRAGWPVRMFVHLEFQSAADPDMALRFLEYGSELFRELRAAGGVARGEPCPILCVAVHNGKEPWRAATGAAELARLPPVLGTARTPPGLAALYPWGYHPLDFARHRDDAPVPGNVVSVLIAIEHAGRNLARLVAGPLREAARDMSPALRGVVAARIGRLAARYGTELQELEKIMRLEEVPPVTSRLEETLDREFAKERSEGREEGIELGRREERETILAQAALKFGRDAVGDLGEPVRALSTSRLLRQAALCIVECASVDEMLGRIRRLADADDRTGAH